MILALVVVIGAARTGNNDQPIQRLLMQSILPLYAGYFLDLSPTQIGMLFSISGVTVFAMIVPAGFLMDRVGRKWCTVPNTGIPALIFLLIPLTTSFTQLSILVGLAGLAQGLSLGSIATSTYDVVPSHVREDCKRRDAPWLSWSVALLRC